MSDFNLSGMKKKIRIANQGKYPRPTEFRPFEIQARKRRRQPQLKKLGLDSRGHRIGRGKR